MAIADRHLSAERIAEYIEGVLTAAERADVERHLADCAECRELVSDTMDLIAAEEHTMEPVAAKERRVIPGPWWRPRETRSIRWVTTRFAAAAIVVVAIRVVLPEWLGFGPRRERPQLQELIAAVANEPTRPVESRLTGGFKYAPAPSPTRGPGAREASPDLRIAEGHIEKATSDSATATDLTTFGVALLDIGEVD